MNNRFSIRFLACLAVLIAVMNLIAPAALAESGKETNHLVTMNIKLESNWMIARYGVKIYLDNEELDHIPQGGMMLKIRNVATGIHTIKISADKYDVPDMSFDIYVGCETTLNASLQTHRKYVSMETMTVAIPGKEITFSDGNSVSWTDFVQDVIAFTMMNCI